MLLHKHNGRPRAPPCTRPPPLLVNFCFVLAGPPKSGGLGTAPAKITPFSKKVASPKRLFPMLARTTRPAFPCTRLPPPPVEFLFVPAGQPKSGDFGTAPAKISPYIFSSRLQAQNGGFQCKRAQPALLFLAPVRRLHIAMDFFFVPAGPPKSGDLGTVPAKITPFFKQVASPKRRFPIFKKLQRTG